MMPAILTRTLSKGALNKLVKLKSIDGVINHLIMHLEGRKITLSRLELVDWLTLSKGLDRKKAMSKSYSLDYFITMVM